MPLQVLGEMPEHSHEHDHSDIRADVMALRAEIEQLKTGQLIQQVEIAAVAEVASEAEEQAEEATEMAEQASEIAVEAVINSVENATPEVENPPEEEVSEDGSLERSVTGTEGEIQRTEEREEETSKAEPVVLQLAPAEREPAAKHEPRRATRFTRGKR